MKTNRPAVESRGTVRGEKTRKRIMARAGRLFRENGFRKVTIEALCADLSMSKRTFYKYFPNRDALVEALMTERFEAFGPLIYDNLNASKPVDEILKAHFDLVLNNLFAHVSTQMMADLQVYFPEIWDNIETFRSGIAATIAELLRRGQQDGSVRPDIDPNVVGKIIQGVLTHLGTPRFLIAEGLGFEQFAATWQNLLANGVLGPQISANVRSEGQRVLEGHSSGS